MLKAVQWASDRLRLIDQTRLPLEEAYLELRDYRQVASAIKEMRVRGAPAIGMAAAYGLVLGAHGIEAQNKEDFLNQLAQVKEELAATRPTAVNLFWALERLWRVVEGEADPTHIKSRLLEEAERMQVEEEASERRLSEYGAELILDGATVLTHCNAGALATVGYGTALGAIRMAHEKGKKVRVYADETRPRLQGARLTAWELQRLGIPVTVIADVAAGSLLARGLIDCVMVGADRIASNGDTANKIGTYPLAVLAMENGVPFYVAAPLSTIDLSLGSGSEIPIEERPAEEVTHIGGQRIPPEGVEVANPAFDVTPHQYITAIITERGVVREPYVIKLKELLEP